MNTGKTQQEWLRKVELDQNVVGLETIEDTLKNEEFRKWFMSQVLNGTFKMGYYNATTGRFELGAHIPEQTVQYSAVSADANTFTVPAGARGVKVHVAMTENDTRNYGAVLSGTINGTAVANLFTAAAASATSGRSLVMVGAAGPTGATNLSGLSGPIVLLPGDSLTMTLNNFVAADTVFHTWIFEVIE